MKHRALVVLLSVGGLALYAADRASQPPQGEVTQLSTVQPAEPLRRGAVRPPAALSRREPALPTGVRPPRAPARVVEKPTSAPVPFLDSIRWDGEILPPRPVKAAAYHVRFNTLEDAQSLIRRLGTENANHQLRIQPNRISFTDASRIQSGAIALDAARARKLADAFVDRLKLVPADQRGPVTVDRAVSRPLRPAEKDSRRTEVQAHYFNYNRTLDGHPCLGGGGLLRVTVSGKSAGVARFYRNWRPVTGRSEIPDSDLRSPVAALEELRSGRFIFGQDHQLEVLAQHEATLLNAEVKEVRLGYLDPMDTYPVKQLLPVYASVVLFEFENEIRFTRLFLNAALTAEALERRRSELGLEYALMQGQRVSALEPLRRAQQPTTPRAAYVMRGSIAREQRRVLGLAGWRIVPTFGAQEYTTSAHLRAAPLPGVSRDGVKIRIYWEDDAAHREDVDEVLHDQFRIPLERAGYVNPRPSLRHEPTAARIIGDRQDWDVLVFIGPASPTFSILGFQIPMPDPLSPTWFTLQAQAPSRVLTPPDLSGQLGSCRARYFVIVSCCQVKEVPPNDPFTRWYEMMGSSGMHAVLGATTYITSERYEINRFFIEYATRPLLYESNGRVQYLWRTIQMAMRETFAEDVARNGTEVIRRIQWWHQTYMQQDYLPGVHTGPNADLGASDMLETVFRRKGNGETFFWASWIPN